MDSSTRALPAWAKAYSAQMSSTRYESGASQAVLEARSAAIEEVSKLLQAPEDLARVAALRAEYESKRASQKAQLTSLVQSHVEATRSGMEVLERGQKSVLKLRAAFEQIDRLCVECSALIENHEKIQMLSITHHNVAKTLEEIDNIIDLPYNANIAEEMLDDESLLEDAYKALGALEGTSSLVQDAMRNNHRQWDEMQNIREYFDKVKHTFSSLEGSLWGHFHNFEVLGRDNPGLLVACVRIVETQEKVDKEVKHPKNWKLQAIKCMEDAITAKFDAVNTKCGDLRVAETAGDEEDEPAHEKSSEEVVTNILQDAAQLSEELPLIYDYVGPCFPPSYDIFHTLWSRYHLQFARVLDSLGIYAEQIANREILGVVQWVENYLETLRGLGIEEEELQMPKYPVLTTSNETIMEQSGFSLLIEKYMERTKESSTAWYLNIIESDLSAEPVVSDEGILWSPGVVDFFRLLNDSLATVENVTQGEMMLQLAKQSLGMMADFVNAQVEVMQGDISFPMMCAFANNNVKCYDMSIDYVEHVEQKVNEEYKDSLEVEEVLHQVCRGFLDAGKLAMQKIVEGIFSDPGVADLLKKLYQGAEWQEGRVTATFTTTLEDYFTDLNEFLDASIFRRVLELALESSVASFTAGLMSKIPPITDSVVDRMRGDEDELLSFFASRMKKEKVESIIQKLSNLRALACSSSIEDFVLSYLTILDSNPNTQPVIVERICNARQDIKRQDEQEILEQCREVYNQRQKTLEVDKPVQPNVSQTPRSTIWQRWREMF